MPSAPARKVGRPALYDPTKFAARAYRLALLGLTNSQLATAFGVGHASIDVWIATEPEFAGALKRGREEADAEVVGCLYARATGYEYTKSIPVKVRHTTYDKNGARVKEVERVELVSVRETLPPDVVACIFWLKNRRPTDWRDRREVSGPDGGPVQHAVTVDLPQLRTQFAERIEGLSSRIEVKALAPGKNGNGHAP